MKAIMVMFDSLNRRLLPPYGCDWVKAPNFSRLAERTVTFENSYVGSMPCMPARRELHTGRCNFLHRAWGPIEPFDDSMPEMLGKAGGHTHLTSDHYHYWEDGGCTYHNRYSTWEISRGQEGDQWKGDLGKPPIPENANPDRGSYSRQDWINRRHMDAEEKMPQAITFANGLEFMRANAAHDRWFLTIETFDPHEPFFTQKAWRDLYPRNPGVRLFDWPNYWKVTEKPEEVEECRRAYAALISMCDHHLGKVLDAMDALDLWKDTMLVVNTDHGFLLGEHGWWAKCAQPFWNEVANTPLFIWDPRSGKRGERRRALVQTIDIAPTLLDFFGVPRTPDMQGKPLGGAVAADERVREAGLFGVHGGHVCVTDGRWVYMRASAKPGNKPLYNYTLMPTNMRGFFGPGELRAAELAGPFSFTKGLKVLRTPGGAWQKSYDFGSLLYDLDADPGQERALKDPGEEKRMVGHLVRLMRENDAPPEQFERLGLK